MRDDKNSLFLVRPQVSTHCKSLILAVHWLAMLMNYLCATCKPLTARLDHKVIDENLGQFFVEIKSGYNAIHARKEPHKRQKRKFRNSIPRAGVHFQVIWKSEGQFRSSRTKPPYLLDDDSVSDAERRVHGGGRDEEHLGEGGPEEGQHNESEDPIEDRPPEEAPNLARHPFSRAAGDEELIECGGLEETH